MYEVYKVMDSKVASKNGVGESGGDDGLLRGRTGKTRPSPNEWRLVSLKVCREGITAGGRSKRRVGGERRESSRIVWVS